MAVQITPAQIRGARAMLNWSMVDLAREAGISVSTVRRLETGSQQVVAEGTRETVQAAMEHAGTRFLADQGDGPGLRWRER